MKTTIAAAGVILGLAHAIHSADISGKVLDKIWRPIAGAKVCLAGGVTCVTSGADGAFHVQGTTSSVATPLSDRLSLSSSGGAFRLTTQGAMQADVLWSDPSGRSLASRRVTLTAGANPLSGPASASQGLAFLSVSAPGVAETWKVLLQSGVASFSEGRSEAGSAGLARISAGASLVVSKDGFTTRNQVLKTDTESEVLVVLGGVGEKVELLFDGKTLDGWLPSSGTKLGNEPASWTVKGGALHAEGTKRGLLVPLKDYGTYRLMFTVRHLATTGGNDHRPCFVFFGMPRDSLNNDALGGLQFQAPYNTGWDYRPGKNNGGTGFTKVSSAANADTWAMCEVIADMAASEAKLSCCNTGGDGNTPCKSKEILRWKEAGWARKPRPWAFQIHNGGLHDEYKNVVIEEDPKSLDFITTGL